jgi:hypothetical protein
MGEKKMMALALRDNTSVFDERPWADSLGFSPRLRERVYVQPPQISLTMSTTENRWYGEAIASIRHLVGLERNWDRRGSAAIKLEILAFSLFLLQEVMPPDSPAPGIVPLGHGGVLLLWHSDAAELEVEITGPNRTEINFTDRKTGQEEEWSLSSDLSSLSALIRGYFRD